jgi:hypothetical protein
VGDHLMRLSQRLPGEHAECLEKIFATQANHGVGTKDVLSCLGPNLSTHRCLRLILFALLFARRYLILL